jgi:hypothetical protein
MRLSHATLRAPRWALDVLRRWSCFRAFDQDRDELEKRSHLQLAWLLRDSLSENPEAPLLDAIS